jgi:hypothetical protein
MRTSLAVVALGASILATPATAAASSQPVGGVFAEWASQPGVQAVAGDFNGDGRADTALVGGTGWYTVPMAFSNGNGTFNVTNQVVPNMSYWANQAGVKAVAGDFNGDRRADIALVGGAGWYTVPMAFSNGNGTFNVTNEPIA